MYLYNVNKSICNDSYKIICNNMVMKTYAERLKYLIELRGTNQSDLARAIGVSPQSIQYLCKDGKRSVHSAKIAKFLKINVDWLTEGEGEMDLTNHLPKLPNGSVTEPNYVLGGFDLWDDDTPLLDNEVALPFFREVELSAGSGKHQVEENHGRKLRFAKSTLKKSNVNYTAAACVTVSGTSMEPVLPDGSVVGIDTSNKTIIDGKPYAINYHGDLLVKRVYKLPGGGFRLNSYNSAEYPDIYCAADALTDVLILGKVFWSSQLW